MNILVFSDSHGDVDTMAAVVERLRPGQVLHLGDHFSDMAKLHLRFPEIPMQGVRGNCDAARGPDSLRLSFGGKRIYLTHGHLHGVKEDLERLYFSALETGADVVLFGHTHRALHEWEKGVELLNPGSIGRGWPPSYAVLTVGEGPFRAEIVTL